MPIQYVGGVTGSRAGSTSTTTQSLSTTLTGGLASTPSDGDLIVVKVSAGTQARTPAMAITTPAGFTARGQQNQTTDTQDVSMNVSWKFRSGTGDNTITIPASGNTADGQDWQIMVFRGVDTLNPFDVADVTAGGDNTARPDPGSITPTTAGAWIIHASVGGVATTPTNLAYTDMTTVIVSSSTDTNCSCGALAFKNDWSSGAFNPAAATAGSTNTANSWCARTMVLRPAAPATATVTDKFPSSLDTAKWPITNTPSTSTITTTDGVLNLNHNWDISNPAWPPARTEIYSIPTKFDGSETYWLYKPLATSDGGAGNAHKAFVHMGVFNQTNLEGVGFSHVPANGAVGSLTCRVFNNVQDEWWQDVGTISGYAPTGAHAYLRVRSSGTTWFWDTAPESGGGPGTWTNQFSYSHSGTGVTFDDLPGFLNGTARVHFEAYHWEDTFQTSYVTAVPRFDNVNTVGSIDYTSDASPATYSHSAPTSKDLIADFSIASPATYLLTPTANTRGFVGLASIASPAIFSFSPNAADSVAATSISVALPATFAMTGVATNALFGRVSNALPATYSYSPSAATRGSIGRASVASPAVFTLTVSPATSIVTLWAGSHALAATYGMTAFATGTGRTYISQAEPATFLLIAPQTGDETTGDEEVPQYPPPVSVPPLTDDEFAEWLYDDTAIRTVLVETQCIDSNGNTEFVYFGSRGFVTKLEDGLNARHYDPLLKGGLDFKQEISLELDGSHSNGDIELDNTDGDLDWMFERFWKFQPIKAYVGDARWPRRDFRQIFDGALQDIDSSQRDIVNIRLRDKLFRLEVPLHEDKVGGSGPDADRLLPVALGECHNITPILDDPVDLRYVFHAREAESVFEVRDNGIPVQRQTRSGAPAAFSLVKQPAGRITASIQGDYDALADNRGYHNTVSELVYRLATRWGTEQGKRYTQDDFDLFALQNFSLNNPQPVGLYVTERMTVLEACQQIAASVGARVTMTALGKLQLIKLQVPPVGNVINVADVDMLSGSLEIVNRPQLISGVRLGYCKNWTIQEDTAAGVPEEHKAMYSREWFSTKLVNPETRDRYLLWDEPEQENCLLLREEDAGSECGRRLWLRSYQRHIYEFTGFADLIFTPLGAPMRITSNRFGLQQGKTGQVVSVAVNWLDATVRIGVYI